MSSGHPATHASNAAERLEFAVTFELETRKSIAIEYAAALREVPPDSDFWPAINDLIVQRWSTSGLLYIKKLAWKRNAERERA